MSAGSPLALWHLFWGCGAPLGEVPSTSGRGDEHLWARKAPGLPAKHLEGTSEAPWGHLGSTLGPFRAPARPAARPRARTAARPAARPRARQSGKCSGGAREVLGRCSEGARKVLKRCSGGVQKVLRRCEKGARKVRKMCFFTKFKKQFLKIKNKCFFN